MSSLSAWVEKHQYRMLFFFPPHFTTVFCLCCRADSVCTLTLCAKFCAKISFHWCPWWSLPPSSKSERGRDAAVIVQRLHPSVSSSVVNHSKYLFYTSLVCVRECVCVYVRDSVKNECWSTWNLFIECIVVFFFQDSIREYRWNYYDWEIHLFLFWWSVTRPDLCLVGLIVQPVKSCQYGIHLFYGCKKCLLCFVCFFSEIHYEV